MPCNFSDYNVPEAEKSQSTLNLVQTIRLRVESDARARHGERHTRCACHVSRAIGKRVQTLVLVPSIEAGETTPGLVPTHGLRDGEGRILGRSFA